MLGTWKEYELLPSPEWTDDHITWQESNRNTLHSMKKDVHGYEMINGEGIAKGHLLGGWIVGKPKDETYYEEYKKAIRQVVVEEEHLMGTSYL